MNLVIVVVVKNLKNVVLQGGLNPKTLLMSDEEIRKNAMQGLWLRIKRLSPYVELNEQIDYVKDIAEQDAKEIEILLNRDIWTRSVRCLMRSLALKSADLLFFLILYLLKVI